jgi:hypothetical protein
MVMDLWLAHFFAVFAIRFPTENGIFECYFESFLFEWVALLIFVWEELSLVTNNKTPCIAHRLQSK